MRRYGPYVMMVAALVAQVGWGVEIGDARAEVLKELGHPSGIMQLGGREAFTYDGGVVELERGRVVYIDPHFDEKSLQAQQAREYEAEQRAKGLVFYDGRWMSPSERDKWEKKDRIRREKEEAERRIKEQQEALKRNPLEHPSIIVHAQGGESMDINSLVGGGKIAIIDFYADWCGPCRRLTPHLKKLVMDHPDVVVHKIDIVNWQSPVAQQYRITSIPHVRVYNRSGQMVGRPTSQINEIADYVNQAD